MVLELKELSKSYFGKRGITDLSVKLYSGQLVGLLGANGSGKTTTLKLLASLLVPTSGLINVFGGTPAQKIGEIAFLGHLDHFLPWMNHTAVGHFMQAHFTNFSSPQYQHYLELLEVPLWTPVKSMSKGQAARLKIAAILARDCQLILLDEPLSGIDFLSREKILSVIQSKRNERTVIVLSTHEILDAQALFDRVLFLKGGQLVEDLPVDKNEGEEGKERVLEAYRRVLG